MYVENKTVWFIANFQNKVHVFKSEKLTEFTEVLDALAIESIMTKGGIPKKMECHEQLNKNIIDYLLNLLS